MKIPASPVALLAALAATNASAQDCSRFIGGDKHLECIEKAADKARAQQAAAKAQASAQSAHVDKDGRKLARLALGGIAPEAEARALPGDRIKAGLGLNNISINYRNSGSRAWNSFASFIYTPVYDEASRHYSDLEKLEVVLRSEKTKNLRPGLRLGQGVRFEEPLDIRIRVETEYGNSFWTEFTAKVEGDETAGFSIPGPRMIDRYSRTAGLDDPPVDPKASVAAPASAPAAVAAAPAPASPPPPSPVEPPRARSEADLITYRPSQGPDYAAIRVTVAGISKKLGAALAQDPLLDKKRSVRVYFKNEGESDWANYKYLTFEGADPASMDLTAEVHENRRLSLQKPLVVRVEARSKGKKAYWQEVRRTSGDLGKPIVIENYGAEIAR